MRAFYSCLVLIIGLVAAGALYAQTFWSGPNFVGQIDLQVKPTGQAYYQPLEEILGRTALFPRAFEDLQPCAGDTQGIVVAVLNSTVTGYGSAVVIGGGAIPVLAWCNGTNYTVIGE